MRLKQDITITEAVRVVLMQVNITDSLEDSGRSKYLQSLFGSACVRLKTQLQMRVYFFAETDPYRLTFFSVISSRILDSSVFWYEANAT